MKNARKSFDFVLFAIFLALIGIGWLMLYSVLYDADDPWNFLSFSTSIGKQTMWLGLSLIAFLLAYTVDWKIWNTFAIPIYAFTMILLVLVLIVGSEVKGAKSWFLLGGISFQPSEIAKFGTALAISYYLSTYKGKEKTKKASLIALAIIFLPIFLILLQSDPGSALLFFSFFILFFRRGWSWVYYIIAFLVAGVFISSLVFSPLAVSIAVMMIATFLILNNSTASLGTYGIFGLLFLGAILLIIKGLSLPGMGLSVVALILSIISVYRWGGNMQYIKPIGVTVLLAIAISYGTSYAFDHFLEPHQQDRINVWLRPQKSDPRGSRYNIIQSMLAIRSGGIQGKGYLKGDMTMLNYVPEQTTDFIFTALGEEQGFIGSISILSLFMLLLFRIIAIGERARNGFIQNFAYSIAGILFFHIFINIGMVLGIMPVIGIPLPFFSKGGSSLLIFSIMIAILLKMDKARYVR